MPGVTIQHVKTYARRTAVTIVGTLAILAALLTLAWHQRADIAETGLHPQVVDDAPDDAVTATWLGVTTLLFDDGETQILVDGFISRPTLFDSLMGRPVSCDAPMINYAINEYGIHRLAAIIPAHSHYDHAMDVGAIANRSSASILGSESTANIARGYGVPEDLLFGFPCICRDGSYEIVQGLEIDDYSRSKIDASAGELAEERDAVRELGLI